MFEGRSRYTPGESAPGHVPPVDPALPLGRQLLDHRRRRGARPGAVGAARPLRVRRLLPRPDRVGAPARHQGARRARHARCTVDKLSSFGVDGRRRVYATSLERPGLPARPALTWRPRGPRHRAGPRGQPGPAHADRHEHVARRPLGDRPRAGARRRTSTRSPPRSPRAAARGDRAHARPRGPRRRARRRCARGSGDVPVVSARGGRRGRRRRSGPLRVLALPGPLRRPPRVRRRPRRVHRRRRARRGQRVRVRPTSPATSTACARLRDARPRGAVPGPRRRRSGTSRAKLDGYIDAPARPRAAPARRARARPARARTSCSTPRGTTRRRSCGRSPRCRCGRTWRSCARRGGRQRGWVGRAAVPAGPVCRPPCAVLTVARDHVPAQRPSTAAPRPAAPASATRRRAISIAAASGVAPVASAWSSTVRTVSAIARTRVSARGGVVALGLELDRDVDHAAGVGHEVGHPEDAARGEQLADGLVGELVVGGAGDRAGSAAAARSRR